MKLNLNAKDDIRVGYINICSENPKNNPDIIVADMSNLPYSQVEEILAIGAMEQLDYKYSIETLNHWYNTLKTGGSIFIQGCDYENMINDAFHQRLTTEQLNGILYNSNNKSIHSLSSMEKLLKEFSFRVVEKGIKNGIFYIRAIK